MLTQSLARYDLRSQLPALVQSNLVILVFLMFKYLNFFGYYETLELVSWVEYDIKSVYM